LARVLPSAKVNDALSERFELPSRHDWGTRICGLNSVIIRDLPVHWRT
jgi:hypothetical protein